MSTEISLQVSDDFHGKRLDAALSGLIANYSRSALRVLIDEGKVSVDGQVQLKPSFKVSSGQTLVVNMPEPENLEAQPQDLL